MVNNGAKNYLLPADTWFFGFQRGVADADLLSQDHPDIDEGAPSLRCDPKN